MKDLSRGAHVSPNIQGDSLHYELENQICDPEHKIENFLESIFDWSGKFVLDIGCGTGFHLPYFADSARHVFGIEPHDLSRLKAMKRVLSLRAPNISLLKGTAETIPLRDSLVDFAIARFAYFWGNGCENGLKEVNRILAPKSCMVIIDNNLEEGTFGPWVKESFNFSDSKQNEVEEFWKDQGFSLEKIHSSWEFNNRQDFENVLRIEFPDSVYKKILTSHQSLTIEYTFNIYYQINE